MPPLYRGTDNFLITLGNNLNFKFRVLKIYRRIFREFSYSFYRAILDMFPTKNDYKKELRGKSMLENFSAFLEVIQKASALK